MRIDEECVSSLKGKFSVMSYVIDFFKQDTDIV